MDLLMNKTELIFMVQCVKTVTTKYKPIFIDKPFVMQYITNYYHRNVIRLLSLKEIEITPKIWEKTFANLIGYDYFIHLKRK